VAGRPRPTTRVATPEVFGYDVDGNLTGDGRWTYTWDLENRLVRMETTDAAFTAGVPKRKIEYDYDARGRRFRSQTSSWSSGTYGTPVVTRYVYDLGWTLLAVLAGQTSITTAKTFLWGLDLSGSLLGAGGVGGLLSMKNTVGGDVHGYAYDGNGNVMKLVKLSDGSISAEYGYGPFGEPLRATGPAAEGNPFRFSTKYQDNETGLVYYGVRYYQSGTGRWINRDPIKEFGGMNLFAFNYNDPVNRFDPTGKRPQTIQQFANKFKCHCLLDSMAAVQKGIEALEAAKRAPYNNLGQYFDRLREAGGAVVGQAGHGVVGAGLTLGKCEQQFVDDVEHWDEFNNKVENSGHPNGALAGTSSEEFATLWADAEIRRMENLVAEMRKMATSLVQSKFCCRATWMGLGSINSGFTGDY
jgi:RHS repeat-associated protein